MTMPAAAAAVGQLAIAAAVVFEWPATALELY